MVPIEAQCASASECKHLGVRLINLNNTLTYNRGIYIFMVTGTTWTFVYKEVVICTIMQQPNGPEIKSLEF